MSRKTITRRELLQSTAATLPAYVLGGLLLRSRPGHGQAPPQSVPHEFMDLSSVLTGFDIDQLDANLGAEYYRRIGEYLSAMSPPLPGLLPTLLEGFQAGGADYIQELMADPACQYQPGKAADCTASNAWSDPDNCLPCDPAHPSSCTVGGDPDSRQSQANRALAEGFELICKWPTQSGCSSPVEPEVVSIQAVAAADYKNQTHCRQTFLCQDIIALWLNSAILTKIPASPLDCDTATRGPIPGSIIPGNVFVYGSAAGYVGGLVYPIAGGEMHPYAQCGGEFGYWNKVPRDSSRTNAGGLTRTLRDLMQTLRGENHA